MLILTFHYTKEAQAQNRLSDFVSKAACLCIPL